jgi:hypothetical protein
VIIDLAAMSFIDSQGIRARGARRTERSGTHVSLALTAWTTGPRSQGAGAHRPRSGDEDRGLNPALPSEPWREASTRIGKHCPSPRQLQWRRATG